MGGIAFVCAVFVNASLTTTIQFSNPVLYTGPQPSIPIVVSMASATNNLAPNSTLDVQARFVAAHAGVFQINFLLLALAELLFIPAVLAVVVAIRGSGRAPSSLGLALGLGGIFFSLMAFPSAFSAISLAQAYAAGTSDTLRTGLLASVLASSLTEGVEAILGSILLSAAVAIAGYAMTKVAWFGKRTGYLGVFAGILGILDSFLPYSLAIVGSILSVFILIWIFLVGIKLVRLSSDPTSPI